MVVATDSNLMLSKLYMHEQHQRRGNLVWDLLAHPLDQGQTARAALPDQAQQLLRCLGGNHIWLHVLSKLLVHMLFVHSAFQS